MTSSQMPWAGSRILPLVVVDEAHAVAPVIDALLHGGISVIEIGLRTPAALEAIEIAVQRGDILVGAGTVTSTSLLQQARDAGASFGLAPSASSAVLDAALNATWPFIPGISTVTEAHHAAERGFSFQKLYPADLLGGEKFARALGATLPDIRLLPSGGVNEGNVESYLSEPNVFAVSGSWIAPRDVIAAGDFEEISRRAREAGRVAHAHG